MKKKLIIALTSLLVAISVSVVAVYAWFVNIQTVFDMQFAIAVVDMRLSLHKIKDFDLDGLPDRDSADEWIVEKTLFDTDKSVNDSEIDQIMAKADSIKNFMPSQVYTYLLKVYNSGDVVSHLIIDSQNIKDGLSNDCLSFTAFYFNQAGERVPINIYSTEANIPIKNKLSTEVPLVVDPNTPSLQVYIQIKCESANGSTVANKLTGKTEMKFTIFA